MKTFYKVEMEFLSTFVEKNQLQHSTTTVTVCNLNDLPSVHGRLIKKIAKEISAQISNVKGTNVNTKFDGLVSVSRKDIDTSDMESVPEITIKYKCEIPFMF